MTRITVLIVDDEPGMRLGAERALKEYTFALPDFEAEIHFTILPAKDGTTALEILDREAVDILLLDHKLPDMQGLDILEQLYREKKEILTIMITAYASIEVAVHATKNGAFDFLAKPFTPEELRITVRKAAEHIFLNRKALELKKRQKEVRFEFISVLAHELKSPLAALENYLFIMRDKMLGEDIQKYEHIIQRSLVRTNGMRRMIFDLLDLTRIESGQKKRDLQDINLRDIARDVVEGVRLEAEKRHITITLKTDDMLVITGDKSEFEIIFNNLLSNGIKYNKDNGEVFLTIQKVDQKIQISCKDTGIGMTEEESQRLFKEFVRIKNRQTENISGSGLGLSIIKKIVHLYDGTVDVKSEPSKGTTFFITVNRKGISTYEKKS